MPTPMIPGDRKPSLGRCSKCNMCTFPSLLHHVSLGKRLCTNCVLRENKTSFCPICYAVYDGAVPSPSDRISCTKCPSSTHIHCSRTTSPPHAPYLCPPCKNLSSTYFSPVLQIEKSQVAMLLCAARIASSLMKEAATSARKSADAKVEEALCARKRAREALDQLVRVTNAEKIRKKEEEEEVDFVKDLEKFLINEEGDVDLLIKEETERGLMMKKEEKDVMIKKEVMYVAI